MINYKRIKIFRLLYGATIVTALVMGIAIARESYVWPLIGFIASIIAFIAYSDALLRCPHCHSRKAMDMVRIRAIRPGFEFYCPMCGELIEIVEPDDPRLSPGWNRCHHTVSISGCLLHHRNRPPMQAV